MKKRIFIAFLSLLLAIFLLGGCEGVSTGLSFYPYEDDDNYCSVTGGGKTDWVNVVIPDKFGESIINCIDQKAFTDCVNLVSISVPRGVKTINTAAFKNCTSLTKIDLPSGLNAIGTEAFYASGLTTLALPNVTELGVQVFSTCLNLATVTFSYSLQLIPVRAFSACVSLTSVTLPEKLKALDLGAFENCIMLPSVTLPDGLEQIGVHAFSGCKSLAYVNLPDTLLSIDDGAFDGCALTSITLPASLESIGSGAFKNCPITEITANCTFVVPFSVFGFKEIPDGFSLKVPADLLEKYKTAEGWSDFADNISATEND